MAGVIDRTGGIALWRQIQEELETEILNGYHGVGERLPTEGALAQRFGVNRHTVRRALAHLKELGLVTSSQGLGFFVAQRLIDYPIGPRTKWKDNIARQNRRPSAHVLGVRRQPASGDVAEQLRLAEGAEVLIIEILRLADESPLTLTYHHLPIPRFTGIEAGFAGSMSLTEAMAAHGVSRFRRHRTWMSARLPRSHEARLLQQPYGQPVLVTAGLNLDQDGVPVEYGISLFAAGRIRLVVEAQGIGLDDTDAPSASDPVAF